MSRNILQILVLSITIMPLFSMDTDGDEIHDAPQLPAAAPAHLSSDRRPLTLEELKALANSEEMQKARTVKST